MLTPSPTRGHTRHELDSPDPVQAALDLVAHRPELQNELPGRQGGLDALQGGLVCRSEANGATGSLQCILEQILMVIFGIKNRKNG